MNTNLIEYKNEQDIPHLGGNGFLMVASRSLAYFYAAIDLMDGILEHNEDARGILFTEREFVEQNPEVFDYFTLVVIDIESNIRSKMWAMAKSPFDVTAYLDADMEVRHSDINNIFDNITDEDIVFTKVRGYTGAQYNVVNKEYWDSNLEYFKENNIERGMTYHGGICLYKNTPEVNTFMLNWYYHFWAQRVGAYEASSIYKERYANEVNTWDQFTLWRLIYEKDFFESNLKIGTFKDDARWNCNYLYRKDEYKDPVVLFHFTIPVETRKARNITHRGQDKVDYKDYIDLDRYYYYG